MRLSEYLRGMNQAGRIPYGRLANREVDEGLLRVTIAILRKIVREQGEMISRSPRLCAAAISWAQKCYSCDCASNLRITLPTTAEELQHTGAQDMLLDVALDLEALYN